MYTSRHSAHHTPLLGLVAGTVFFLAACTSAPVPSDQMAVSTAALASAVSAGAGDLAPADLKTARDKLDRAAAAMTARNYDLARALAMEAEADARLAEVRARSAKAQRGADEVDEARRVLREEMNRKTQ
ncbi:DUF4398 domain-containing protein [Sphaerotilus sp.]|uniref:DUF4398 domain-containing protein n=1 Tax=Sphaerotilus sp. TaxID=2093942 RepID=UPI00286E2239|nr:DUF4398 domain-containing protein [Sphaerotilus sp.]